MPNILPEARQGIPKYTDQEPHMINTNPVIREIGILLVTKAPPNPVGARHSRTKKRQAIVAGQKAEQAKAQSRQASPGRLLKRRSPVAKAQAKLSKKANPKMQVQNQNHQKAQNRKRINHPNRPAHGSKAKRA